MAQRGNSGRVRSTAIILSGRTLKAGLSGGAASASLQAMPL